MNLKTKCLVCGTSENLNTSMHVKIEEGEYDIDLCDKHADTSTPKQVKNQVKKKILEFKKLSDKMKEFGIEINGQSKGGIILASNTNQGASGSQA